MQASKLSLLSLWSHIADSRKPTRAISDCVTPQIGWIFRAGCTGEPIFRGLSSITLSCEPIQAYKPIYFHVTLGSSKPLIKMVQYFKSHTAKLNEMQHFISKEYVKDKAR